MGTPSRERQLIDGVWQYVTVSESPGGGLPAGGSTGEVLTKESNADGDAGWEPGGGSQPFGTVVLRTSLDFADPTGTIFVLPTGFLVGGEITLAIPPSPFGNNGVVRVRVYNDGSDTFVVGGELVVCKADGLVYLAQDASPQTVPAADFLDVDFDSVNVSAGAGLSWSVENLQIDIASEGVFSAYVVINAYPST